MTGSMRAVLAALIFSSLVPGSALGRQGIPKLISVRTVDEGGTIAVIIESNGPLPMPLDGSLENPPRLFFDFEGVLPARTGIVTTAGAGVVRQTRFARHAPDVTRVVLDLVRSQSYRIEADERAAGHIRILVGSAAVPPRPVDNAPSARPVDHASPPAVAAPPLPRPLPPPTSIDPVSTAPKPTAKPAPPAAAVPLPPVTPEPIRETAAPPGPPGEPTSARRRPTYTPPPSAPKPPLRAVTRFREQLPGVLERMEAQQPILVLVDAEGSVSAEALEAAMTELTSLRRVMDQFRPPEALASAHQMLIAYCTLGATASRLGMEASKSKNVETRKNAASAAAGALMFFDRACADLGCSRPQH